MSSSETPAPLGPFVKAFCLTVLAGLSAVAALLLVVDPVGAGPGNAVCAAGAKTRESVYSKPLLPGIAHPQTVVLGTSRVHYGFDPAALRGMTVHGPVANLGIAAGLPRDWRVLGDGVLAHAERPVIYLGVDFNAAYQGNTSQFGEAAPSWHARQFAHWRGPWFSEQALQILPGALPGCQIGIRRDGSPMLDGLPDPLGQDALRSPERLQAALREEGAAGRVDQRLAEIDGLLRHWQRSGATVVLFSAPYRPELLAIYREEGMDGTLARYHRQLAAIAERHHAVWFDFNRPDLQARLHLSPCPRGGIGCHYFDLSHYRPAVAQAMAPVLRQAALDLRARRRAHGGG